MGLGSFGNNRFDSSSWICQDIKDAFKVGRFYLSQSKPVRVPDQILDCVGFIAQFDQLSEGLPAIYDLEGSGVFVSIPCTDGTSNQFFTFVTAAHVLERLDLSKTRIIVTSRGGGKAVIQPMAWFRHHDPSVDLAIAPYFPFLDLHHVMIGQEMFLTPDEMKRRNIGIGDEVFFPGLFSFAPGHHRNIPICRHGNIAMLPDSPIQVDEGFSDVYLIEARSIGGISGSPVFARQTVSEPVNYVSGEKGVILLVEANMLLLGIVRGHWDIKEREINSPSAIQDRQRGVNMGIAVVTPAPKIVELINEPEFVRWREMWQERARKNVAPGND